MASSKYYAYYIRGRQVAIVQHDYTLGSGQTLSQPGLNSVGARGDVLWKSPTEAISKGLEIEYAYSPRYTLESTGTEGTDFHQFIGWGSNGTELLLFTYGAAAVRDLSSGPVFAANDYIVISGSSKWNGLHQVKSTGGATGILTLKTKCNLKPSKISVTGSFANIGGTFNGDGTAADLDIEAFKDLISTYDGRETPYIFVDGAEDVENNGIFSVTYDTTSGQITFGNKITIDADGDYTSTAEDIQDEDGDTGVIIYNMFYEQISVFEGVNVLQDESDTIDLPEYLAKALVYYVKAKIAEDRGELEQKEYNMREFKRLLERHESSKIWGARRIGTGDTAIK